MPRQLRQRRRETAHAESAVPLAQPRGGGRLGGAVAADGEGAPPAGGDEVARAGVAGAFEEEALGRVGWGGGRGALVGAAEGLLDQEGTVGEEVVPELAAGEGEGVEGVEVEVGG